MCAHAAKTQHPAASLGARSAESWAMPAVTRPHKITFGEMRSSGVHGLLVYCADYGCSHSTAISADQWTDDVRFSDLELLFVCQACGERVADVRPNFDWEEEARRATI